MNESFAELEKFSNRFSPVFLLVTCVIIAIIVFSFWSPVSKKESRMVSEDPALLSLESVDGFDSSYSEREVGHWNVSGKYRYSSEYGGLVVHPWPAPLDEWESYRKTNKSGIEQLVRIPESGEYVAVLKGKNIASYMAPDRDDCADSRMILEVSTPAGEDTLRKSKIVGNTTERLKIDVSSFSGSKVFLAGYGYYGGDGCGRWSGEFTLLESLYIRKGKISSNFSDKKLLSTYKNRSEDYTNLNSIYKVPSNRSFPEIKYGYNWWRKVDYPPYRVFKRDYCQPLGGWSRTVIDPPVKTCINSHGYRGKPYNKTVPDNAFRIMAVGDAVTFGQGVADNETYPAYLEDYLEGYKNLSEGINFQVINYGFPAFTTKKEVQIFRRHGVNYNPDLVVLQYMENDAQRLELIRQKLIPRYRQNLSKELDDRRAVQVISARTAFRVERQERKSWPLEKEMRNVTKHFEILDNLSEKHDFEVLLMHYSTDFSERHREYVRRQAERLGWWFFDSDLARVEGYRQQDYMLNPDDDFYLNSLGYNLTARQLYRYIEQENIVQKSR